MFVVFALRSALLFILRFCRPFACFIVIIILQSAWIITD